MRLGKKVDECKLYANHARVELAMGYCSLQSCAVKRGHNQDVMRYLG